jgi:diguanylate cyclase (GGDEF)-like protein
VQRYFTDRQKLWASALTVLAVTFGLGLMLILPHHADYRDSQRRLQALDTFRAALELGHAVSAERGPANSVMGEPVADAQAARARLQEFRDRGDLRFERLREAIDREGWRDRAGWLMQLDRLRARLTEVRGQVDRIAAQPPDSRDALVVAGTVDQAFRVVDGLQPLITVAGTRLAAVAPSASGDVILARVLFDAREYGGRLASLAIPSVISRTPLAPGTQAAMERMRGRLGALQEVLLHSDLSDLDGNDQGDAPHASGAIRSLQEGMRIMDRLLAQGAATGRYPLTARMLTDAYVPNLRPLEEARDSLLAVIDARLRQERAEARRILGWTLAALAAMLGTVVATLWLAQRQLFAPLLAASRELVALAGQPAPTAAPAPRARSEIRRLQDALQVLRHRLQEHDLLDRQRPAGGAQPERAAETDALTGLADRRALYRIGENLAGYRRARDLASCLILFEVDGFERIAVRHGRPAGDRVLRAVAAVAAANVRTGDLLARFDGEEFAVLVFDPDESRAMRLAEKIRAALAEASLSLPDGRPLRVTASFGVASGSRGVLGWLDLLDRADRALHQAQRRGRDRVCGGDDLADEA